jgi:hypothetical protein
MSAGLKVQVRCDEYAVIEGQEFTFGRSQECSHCLDPDDAAISRRAGMIRSENGTWFVLNISSARQLNIADEMGMRSVLAPGRRFALEGEMQILVPGSKPKPYVLHVSAPRPQVPLAEPSADGTSTVIGDGVSMTPEERIALVALFAGYLEDGEHYDPYPRSYEAAANRLGWPRTKLVKKIEYLRARLDKAGVPSMNGWNALNNLAEYVLTRSLITKGDLALLPGR